MVKTNANNPQAAAATTSRESVSSNAPSVVSTDQQIRDPNGEHNPYQAVAEANSGNLDAAMLDCGSQSFDPLDVAHYWNDEMTNDVFHGNLLNTLHSSSPENISASEDMLSDQLGKKVIDPEHDSSLCSEAYNVHHQPEAIRGNETSFPSLHDISFSPNMIGDVSLDPTNMFNTTEELPRPQNDQLVQASGLQTPHSENKSDDIERRPSSLPTGMEQSRGWSRFFHHATMPNFGCNRQTSVVEKHSNETSRQTGFQNQRHMTPQIRQPRLRRACSCNQQPEAQPPAYVAVSPRESGRQAPSSSSNTPTANMSSTQLLELSARFARLADVQLQRERKIASQRLSSCSSGWTSACHLPVDNTDNQDDENMHDVYADEGGSFRAQEDLVVVLMNNRSGSVHTM